METQGRKLGEKRGRYDDADGEDKENTAGGSHGFKKVKSSLGDDTCWVPLPDPAPRRPAFPLPSHPSCPKYELFSLSPMNEDRTAEDPGPDIVKWRRSITSQTQQASTSTPSAFVFPIKSTTTTSRPSYAKAPKVPLDKPARRSSSFETRGLYSVIMPTTCAYLRSDGSLGALANLMQVSKAMYGITAESLYEHLEITKSNIMGILWGLPYIPPHSLHAVMIRYGSHDAPEPAKYPLTRPAILEPPYAPWVDPADTPSGCFAAPDLYNIPTGASVARKVALLAMCRKLTVWQCPTATASATIRANHNVHSKSGSILHGVRYLRIAAGVHEELSDYYHRLQAEHPFFHVLKHLHPIIGCIDSKPVWTERDFTRSHTGVNLPSSVGLGQGICDALRVKWKKRPSGYETWRNEAWQLDDKNLVSMVYHHPHRAGLINSDSSQCLHRVVFSAAQGQLPLSQLRKDWSGVAKTIGSRLSSIFYSGPVPVPLYEIICPVALSEVDPEYIQAERKAALLEDVERHMYITKKDTALVEVAKRIAFLSPTDIPPCPCCGK